MPQEPETPGFNLRQFPDRYRHEFQANRDWMRLTFHARANDPDRPYLNAPAAQVVSDYRLVTKEIERFAGRELLSPVTTIHWGEATREACAALRAEGVTTLAGYFEFRGGAPRVSYYLTPEQVTYLSGRDYWKDTSLGLLFIRHDMVVNNVPLAEIVPRLEKLAADPHQSEVLELMIHEQQYHPDFRGYVPDYKERVERAIGWATKNRYRPVFFMEGFAGAPEQTGFVEAVPKTIAEWGKRRSALRSTLRRLLGGWPPLFTPKAEVLGRAPHPGYTLERIRFDNGAGAAVPGYVLVPEGRRAPGPAILYNHYHGGEYANGKEEVIRRAFSLLDFATGEELARQGYLVLAIDSYAFGERRWSGPGGPGEEGRAAEWSLFKDFLWRGRTLWGMMVRDDLLALNYLSSRPDVDPKRIAAMGMSMGSTRSWWAAAMDDRIKVTVSVACLTRYQNLAANGAHSQHGFYYFVPGMLKEKIDTESVAGLIAPRPHLTLTGAADEGSPFEGVQLVNDFQRRLYALYGRPGSFRGILYPGVGHKYTPEMWRETLAWLKKHL